MATSTPIANTTPQRLCSHVQEGLPRLIREGAACLRAARALLVSEEQGEEQGEVELRLRMGGATLAD